MNSIIDLIDQATGKVEEAARYSEGGGGIWRIPPNTDDPIDDPRVISPRFLNNGALPIGIETQPPVPTPQTDEGRKPIRVLSRTIANQPSFDFVRSAVEQLSSEKAITGFNDDQSVRVLNGRVMPRNAPLGGSVDPPGNPNGVTGASQPDRPPSPYSLESPRGLAGRIAALAGNASANPIPRALASHGTGFENDGPQPWLFRALNGRL